MENKNLNYILIAIIVAQAYWGYVQYKKTKKDINAERML